MHTKQLFAAQLLGLWCGPLPASSPGVPAHQSPSSFFRHAPSLAPAFAVTTLSAHCHTGLAPSPFPFVLEYPCPWNASSTAHRSPAPSPRSSLAVVLAVATFSAQAQRSELVDFPQSDLDMIAVMQSLAPQQKQQQVCARHLPSAPLLEAGRA
jgi:hypothetical protein